MANQTTDSKDCDVVKISEDHLGYLKSKLIHYLSSANDFSAEIHRIRGQSAKLVFFLGTKPAKKEDNESQNQTPDKIVVKNLPPSIDNQYLDMFFEYTKGQGGGPVKSVTFNRMENFAIVQFEETKAVDTVIDKKPIQMLGTIVDVEPYIPYLETDEHLESIDLKGLPKELVNEIALMNLKDQHCKPPVPQPAQQINQPGLKPPPQPPQSQPSQPYLKQQMNQPFLSSPPQQMNQPVVMPPAQPQLLQQMNQVPYGFFIHQTPSAQHYRPFWQQPCQPVSQSLHATLQGSSLLQQAQPTSHLPQNVIGSTAAKINTYDDPSGYMSLRHLLPQWNETTTEKRTTSQSPHTDILEKVVSKPVTLLPEIFDPMHVQHPQHSQLNTAQHSLSSLKQSQRTVLPSGLTDKHVAIPLAPQRQSSQTTKPGLTLTTEPVPITTKKVNILPCGETLAAPLSKDGSIDVNAQTVIDDKNVGVVIDSAKQQLLDTETSVNAKCLPEVDVSHKNERQQQVQNTNQPTLQLIEKQTHEPIAVSPVSSNISATQSVAPAPDKDTGQNRSLKTKIKNIPSNQHTMSALNQPVKEGTQDESTNQARNKTPLTPISSEQDQRGLICITADQTRLPREESSEMYDVELYSDDITELGDVHQTPVYKETDFEVLTQVSASPKISELTESRTEIPQNVKAKDYNKNDEQLNAVSALDKSLESMTTTTSKVNQIPANQESFQLAVAALKAGELESSDAILQKLQEDRELRDEAEHKVELKEKTEDETRTYCGGGVGVYKVIKCGSSGHSIRSGPNLKASFVGRLTMANQISVKQGLINEDGTWVKLDNDSIVQYCQNKNGEGWALAKSVDGTEYLRHESLLDTGSQLTAKDPFSFSTVPPQGQQQFEFGSPGISMFRPRPGARSDMGLPFGPKSSSTEIFGYRGGFPDQWSPDNREGKKCYDREFLLQFQSATQALIKPAGLPDIPGIVLDKPHTGARGKHTTADGGDTTCHEPLVYEFRPQYNWISTGGAGKKKKPVITKDKGQITQNTSQPSHKIYEELHRLIVKEKRDNETVAGWIESNVDGPVRKSSEFIRTLMTCVCDGALKTGDDENIRVEPKAFEMRHDLLQKYMNNVAELELQALYALQELVTKLEHPAGVLQQLFDTLHDNGIISEDTFTLWEEIE